MVYLILENLKEEINKNKMIKHKDNLKQYAKAILEIMKKIKFYL